jgi:hypothetical protein
MRKAILATLAAVGAAAVALFFVLRDPPRPHVIVYLVDTLRADHMGIYGYDRDTTPFIDALSKESIVFDAAYAPTSWTRPSIGTLFTGVLPSRHGARRMDQQLRPDIVTLAEALRAEGYATHGFTCNPAVGPAFGFERGFDTYEHYGSLESAPEIRAVHDPVEALLARAETTGPDAPPLFLYVHTCAPHSVYAPPPPFNSRFKPRSPDLIDRAAALYDGEIAWTDAELEKLVQELRDRGVFENSLFLLMSDHGEEFGEHGGTGHAETLFEEVVRVPLLMRLPGGWHSGLRVASRASLADLFPTILDLVGAPARPGLDGVDLQPAWQGAEPNRDRELFFELDLREHVVDALMRSDRKIIDRQHPTARAGRQLYAFQAGSVDFPVEDEPIQAALADRLDDVRYTLRAGLYVELANARTDIEEHHVVGRLDVPYPAAPEDRAPVSAAATSPTGQGWCSRYWVRSVTPSAIRPSAAS